LRVKIVLGLLVVLFLATGALTAARPRIPHTAPSPASPAGALADAGADAAEAGRASAATSGSASAPLGDAGALDLMDRPLRTITLGWDLAAPAVLANGGLDPAQASEFTAAGVATHLKPVEAMSVVEAALARGGADREGADIAVIPFSELCASYERLRALSPEVFFVVGWSRGREALVSTHEALPSASDKSFDDGAGSGPRPRAPAEPQGKAGDKLSVSMVGAPGEAATFLGLFALDANGIPPGAVHLVAHEERPGDPPLAAVDRDALGETARHTILLTTADATRLVPFVAVAQHGLLDQHGRALAAWARVWLEATRKLDRDPPSAARAIAAAPGAPEPIALLKRLGEMAPASLGDNARAFGLSGRGALTLDALFQQTWRIWRGAGALATPAPDTTPINGSIITSLARSYPSLASPPVAQKPKPGAASPDTLKAFVTYRQPEGKVDDTSLLATTGLLADVFDRSTLRVAVVKGDHVDAAATKHLVDDVEQRFDVAPERVVAAKKAPGKVGAAVEVLVAP
jgi:hypothetical protein